MDASLLNSSMTDYASSWPLNATSPLQRRFQSRDWGLPQLYLFLELPADEPLLSKAVAQPCWSELCEGSTEGWQDGGDMPHCRRFQANVLTSKLHLPQESCLVQCLVWKQALCTCLLIIREKLRREKCKFKENAQRPCTNRLSDLARGEINAVISGQAVRWHWLEE